MDRVEKVYASIERQIDVIIIKNEGKQSPNCIYITGTCSKALENSVVVVRREGIDALISKLEEGNSFPEHINIHVPKDKRDARDRIRKLVPEGAIVGHEGMNLSYKSYKDLRRLLPRRKFVDISEDLLRARFKKDKEEIGKIQRACRIADRVMEEAISALKEGITERELAIEIDYLMMRYGDGKAFDSIVAFGKNSAIPHYETGRKKLNRGDIVLIDMGATYRGYVSDLTRTFVFGKARKRQRMIHEVVDEAQKIAVNAIEEGKNFEEVHSAVQEFIDKKGFKGYFLHSTGHTIGLEVHDGFSIGKGSKENFASGVTFTIEPGIYIKNFGGVRLEDVFLFDKGNVKALTKASKLVEV